MDATQHAELTQNDPAALTAFWVSPLEVVSLESGTLTVRYAGTEYTVRWDTLDGPHCAANDAPQEVIDEVDEHYDAIRALYDAETADIRASRWF